MRCRYYRVDFAENSFHRTDYCCSCYCRYCTRVLVVVAAASISIAAKVLQRIGRAVVVVVVVIRLVGIERGTV